MALFNGERENMTDVMNIATVRPYRPDDYAELVTNCMNDGHVVIAPTHVVVKDGRIVGYFSLGGIPLCLLWMDTKNATVMDSFVTAQTFENIARANGAQLICTPCVDKSPLLSYMERTGYAEQPGLTMFLKKL